MRIAVDARAMSGRRAGKGRFIEGFLEGLAELGRNDELLIYVLDSKEAKKESLTKNPNWKYINAPASIRGARWLARDAQQNQADCLLAGTAFSVSLFSKIPTSSIIYDLAVFRCPEARGSLKTQIPERLFLGQAVKRSQSLVAISKFTESELFEMYPQAKNKTTIAYGAADDVYTPIKDLKNNSDAQKVIKKYNLPEDFVFYVGTIEPRKNLIRLVEAFSRLPEDLQEKYPLILAGKMGWLTDQIEQTLLPLEQKGYARRLGYVEDRELPLLYNLATAVAYVPIYEGFGLPALEALACGVPLLTSKLTSLPEVVADSAISVNPYSVDNILEGLHKILTDKDLRTNLSKMGPKQASNFSWQDNAKAILDSLERAIEKH